MDNSSTIHVHKLDGCRPTPLAHYLKALGILRLVSEQKDVTARGWWRDDVFHLATRLNDVELETFFLKEYIPTPILSPWLKGSGFYKANDPGLVPIEQSEAPRFKSFRNGILESRKQLNAILRADSVIRSIKARTKRNKTFQTPEQRDFLAKSVVFQTCIRELIEECDILNQLMGGEQKSENDSLSEEALKVMQKLKNENISAQDKSNKLKSELETIESLICKVEGKTSDKCLSKSQADKLKTSDGYSRILGLAEREFAELKSDLIVKCKQSWRGALSKWFAAAVVIGDDKKPNWPALLGSGGNDGNLDFTNNSMQQLGQLFDLKSPDGISRPVAKPLFELAFFNVPYPNLGKVKIGQFSPATAGGTNSSTGYDGESNANPWDYILMLEGAILFRAGVSRRCQSQKLPKAAAPFAVHSSGAGYGSSDSTDTAGRGEQWIPLWNQPSSLHEVSALFYEGRSQIVGKIAEQGTDMARAVARMGVARGIQQFERFGYLKRNGDNHYAVSLGRFGVNPRSHQDLLDEVVPWIDRLRSIASDKLAPESFDRVHRACEEAVFNCTRDRHGHGFLSLLISLAIAENRFIQSPKFSAEQYARPIPCLDERWLHVVREEEDSVELRLAIALAAQHGNLKSNEPSQSIRIHWSPIDGNYFAKGESGLSIGPEQSPCGFDLQRALIAMMHRRLLAYQRGAAEFIPLELSNPNAGATPEDIQAFIEHRVDDARILAIARGLMAIKFRGQQKSAFTPKASHKPLGGLALYSLLRLAMPTAPIRLHGHADKYVRCNPTLFYRLSNGNVNAAVQIATRQLAASGLRPRLRFGVGSPQLGRRLAASMAFGISPATTARFVFALTAPEIHSDSQRERVNA